jgi:hypothetical protein
MCRAGIFVFLGCFVREIGHNLPVTKTRWFHLAALLAMVVLGVASVWLSLPAAEAVYQGKPLHYWLQGYDPITSLPPAPGPTRQDADQAVIALGTNAIPDLLRMLVYRQSPLIPRLLATGQRLHLIKDQHADPYSRHREAQHAFVKLGNQAAQAVAELIRLYDAYPDPSSRTSILMVLGCIGPKAKEAVPVFLRAITNASDAVRLNAVNALSKDDADAGQVVPVLINCLKDPNPLIQQRAIDALSQFGREARPAVPALLQLLRDEKYDPAKAPTPRMLPMAGIISIYGGFPGTNSFLKNALGAWSGPADLAASALWKIDPDAAAQTQLKLPE